MTDRPLVGYIVVEVDYNEDRDQPIHSFVSSPFPTREKAERERERKKQAYEDVFEDADEDEVYDAKDFTVTEIHVRPERQLREMDEERYETMMGAVNAVGSSLLAADEAGESQ